jgi:hypothetical protein
MMSDLASAVESILPFAERTMEDVLCDDADLLEGVVRRLYELIGDTATFICGYAKRSPTCEFQDLACNPVTHPWNSPNPQVCHTHGRSVEDQEPTRQVQ